MSDEPLPNPGDRIDAWLPGQLIHPPTVTDALVVRVKNGRIFLTQGVIPTSSSWRLTER